MTHLPNQTKVQCKSVWLPSSQPPVGASSDILGWRLGLSGLLFLPLVQLVSLSFQSPHWVTDLSLGSQGFAGLPWAPPLWCQLLHFTVKTRKKKLSQKKKFKLPFQWKIPNFEWKTSKCINLHFKRLSLILSSICTGKLSQNHSALRSLLISSLKLLIFFLLCT